MKMEYYGKVLSERPYIHTEFKKRLRNLERTIKRKLNSVERIRLLDKVIVEDDVRKERQKTLKPCWITISKPKMEESIEYGKIDEKDICDMKEMEREEHQSKMAMLGWDRG
jgi:hypothetical protein